MISKVVISFLCGHSITVHDVSPDSFRGLRYKNARPHLIEIQAHPYESSDSKLIHRSLKHVVGVGGKVLVNGTQL